jgi:hypothetical protein
MTSTAISSPSQERPEGRVGFGGFERGAEGVRLLRHPRLHSLRVAAQEAAGREQGGAGLGGEGGGLFHRVRQKLGLRQEGVDEAEAKDL